MQSWTPWDNLILTLDAIGESFPTDEAYQAAVARGEAEQARYEAALAKLKAPKVVA